MIVLNNELIQAANCYIDENHEDFSELGKRFFDVFSYNKTNDQISTQVRNLQQIACSATRFADIEDFVKNQMGKEDDKNPRWRALGDDGQALGDEILQKLKQLREKSLELNEDSTNQMALRLRLARGWVRAVVSEYLYQVALDQMGGNA